MLRDIKEDSKGKEAGESEQLFCQDQVEQGDRRAGEGGAESGGAEAGGAEAGGAEAGAGAGAPTYPGARHRHRHSDSFYHGFPGSVHTISLYGQYSGPGEAL